MHSKILAVPVILTSMTLMCSAQSWAPPDAIWRYNYIGLAGRGYVQISYVKDTVINGIDCKKLNKRLFQENAFTGTIQSYNIGSLFTFENNGVVYIRYGGVFDTLYHFNALPGQWWYVPGTSPVSHCQTNTKVEVIDTATIQINNVPLRQLIVNYYYFSSNNPIKDTIIERIGSLRQYMVPWDLCLSMADGHEGGELRCYTDSLLGEYKHNFYSECTVLIGMDERKTASLNITLFPHPVYDVFSITTHTETTHKTSGHVTIYDLYGNIIFSTDTDDINITIDLTKQLAGIYILHISKNGMPLLRRSIVKL